MKPKSSSVCLIELANFRLEGGDIMCEEREKVRCRNCELVQWSDRASCRRCGKTLPEPLVKVVEKVVIRYAPECLQSLEEARRLISEAEAPADQTTCQFTRLNRPGPVCGAWKVSHLSRSGTSHDRYGLPAVESQNAQGSPPSRDPEDDALPQAQVL
jgi:hypothetical protein